MNDEVVTLYTLEESVEFYNALSKVIMNEIEKETQDTQLIHDLSKYAMRLDEDIQDTLRWNDSVGMEQ